MDDPAQTGLPVQDEAFEPARFKRARAAAERTWDIDGDVNAELRHKPAESLWWVPVLADKLGVDVPDAFNSTMDKIAAGLERALGDEGVGTSGGPATG